MRLNKIYIKKGKQTLTLFGMDLAVEKILAKAFLSNPADIIYQEVTEEWEIPGLISLKIRDKTWEIDVSKKWSAVTWALDCDCGKVCFWLHFKDRGMVEVELTLKEEK